MKKLALATLLALAFAAQPASAADPVCVSGCQANYDSCVAECGSFGTFWCYDDCDNQYNTCYYGCTLCPSTRDYSTTTVLSQQHTGLKLCLEESPFANYGFKFWEYLIRYRVTNYRETTQCDGTKTTTVLSTSDNQTFCMEKSPFPNDYCSPYQPRTGFNFCS